uniref:Uncharacterized protein n=1 Tax=Arundo donax TaxID=35708 RepID=A0A0A9BF42_ARUDO
MDTHRLILYYTAKKN